MTEEGNFIKTESPSMDILISSNLERLLFELADRKAGSILDWMNQLATRGWYQIPHDALDRLQSQFYGGFADRHGYVEIDQRGL